MKIVIDSERDFFQPERLVRALRERTGYMRLADNIEAQLPKPKPAEPTGFGAVVEEADGTRWARVGSLSSGNDWACEHSFTSWDNLDAVTVLSEGVQS